MYCKDDVPAGKIRSTLQHYNKYLGINCKEVNPKQTKLKWNKNVKRKDIATIVKLALDESLSPSICPKCNGRKELVVFDSIYK